MNLEKFNEMVEKATLAIGSQRKLAEILDIAPPSLIQMKQGKRHANWRVRGKLRAILGEDPTHAFMAEMADELSNSENEDEKKAARGLDAMLAAFSEGWRKRMNALAFLPFDVLSRLNCAINSALSSRLRNAVFLP